ncbi:MAG: hypothetical protein COB67_04185 [SAR324 cluster bacterium]|uniref:NodB homology domain-containing protein n=1 Tax=SAR324 cluster bacterium TaxID=2024889 RepID=A0A2A4T744_9DELT|nr:MAG: hypothetical protein COB67_04185 [SAR324 cluster bacterium]
MSRETGFVSLCYHYLRPKKGADLFPRLLGTRIEEFRQQVETLKKSYQVLSPEEILRFYRNEENFNMDKPSLLFTFDDGLSDHFLAAQILAEKGIKGLFFVPSCILSEKLPANPTIIHYCLAIYKVEGFLKVYRDAIAINNLSLAKFDITYRRGVDDPWEVIRTIKYFTKYKLGYINTRKILLHIYREHLLRDFPKIMEEMHLSKLQIQKVIAMGHSIGTHSHSHLSVAASELPKGDFYKEMIFPKSYLEETFGIPVYSMSYPFGGQKDCLKAKDLDDMQSAYDIIFTVEKVLNTQDTNPLELGRYMPMSTDNVTRIDHILQKMIQGQAV